MSDLKLLYPREGKGLIESSPTRQWQSQDSAIDIVKKRLVAHYPISFQPSLVTRSFMAKAVPPSDQIFEREKNAFLEIKRRLIGDPQYTGKYIAIVNGEIAGVGDDRVKLAREIYTKIGYVTMYIGEVVPQETVAEEPSFEML